MCAEPNLTKKKPFDAPAGINATADQTRGQHLGVVEDHEIAGVEELRQIANMSVHDLIIAASHNHQTR